MARIIRSPIFSCCRWDGEISEILRVSSNLSFNFSNENLSKKCDWSSNLFFSSVMLKIVFYTSRLVNPTVHDPSIEIGGSKWNVSLGWDSLNSDISSAFRWVCSLSISQFLVIESNNTCVSFLGWIMSNFIHSLHFNSWQINDILSLSKSTGLWSSCSK